MIAGHREAMPRPGRTAALLEQDLRTPIPGRAIVGEPLGAGTEAPCRQEIGPGCSRVTTHSPFTRRAR